MSEEEATDFRRAEFDAFKKARIIDFKSIFGQNQQEQEVDSEYDAEFEKI